MKSSITDHRSDTVCSMLCRRLIQIDERGVCFYAAILSTASFCSGNESTSHHISNYCPTDGKMFFSQPTLMSSFTFRSISPTFIFKRFLIFHHLQRRSDWEYAARHWGEWISQVRHDNQEYWGVMTPRSLSSGDESPSDTCPTPDCRWLRGAETFVLKAEHTSWALMCRCARNRHTPEGSLCFK